MGGQNSGRQNITTEDWMRDMERRTMHEERRNQIRTSSDLLGPGIAPQAIQLTDWNDEATLFNGFYYSIPQAAPAHSPDDSKYWMGYNVVNIDGNGYQRIYEYRGEPDAATQVSYTRRFSSLAGTRAFEAWVLSGSGAGGGGSPLSVQDENVTIVTGATTLDFQGAGVSAAPGASGEAIVTINGVSNVPDAGVAVMYDGTSTVASTNTSNGFVGVTGGAQGDFIAPKSGKVVISVGGYLKSSVAGVYSHLTFQWLAFPTPPGQPPVGNSANEAFSTQDTGYTKAVHSTLVTGLLPGGLYTVRVALMSGASTNNASIANSRIIVTPVDLAAGGAETGLFATKIVATADLSLANAAVTNVVFGATAYDTGGMADLTNNRIVIKRAGYYRFNAHAVFANNATGYRAVIIRINGAIISDEYLMAASASVTIVSYTTEPMLCAAGDLITMSVVQGSGAALLLTTANSRYSHLEADWVAPAAQTGGLGQVGYAEITANAAVAATGLITTAPTDVPGLAVSVQMYATRRYRVIFDGQVYGTVANDRAQIGLFDGATLMNFNQSTQMAVITNGYGAHVERVMIAPTTGTHTIKVALGRQSGTGSINMLGAATAVSSISVEDIGSA